MDANTDSIKRLDDGILRSLAFPQMFDRRSNVEQPHTKTCQWIFELQEYQHWVAQTSGLLWIKGKPGSGKSTIMSHIYRTVYRTSKTNVDRHKIYLDFFFNARGVPLQHNQLGMLRSLFSQLFYQASQIRDILRDPYQEKNNCFGANSESTGWQWQRPELETLFSEAILAAAKQSQVTILIDALDEAGEWAAKETARYFQNLNTAVNAASASVKICISSRHYPIPTSLESVEIHVEKHNSHDIAAYVRDYLHVENLPGRDERRSLVTYLIDQAGGIFQWVRLVLPIVQQQLDELESFQEIQKWLSHVPGQLSDMYKHILTIVVEPRHRKISFQLFQWVCLAKRPLSITELRHALNFQDSMYTGLESEPWRYQNLKSRIRSCSGGLLEVVQPLFGSDMVQVSHQSVKDFFTTHGFDLFAQLNGSGPSTIAECHGSLYWTCLKYMSISLNGKMPFNDCRRISLSNWKDAETLRAEILRNEFPFRSYAIQSMLFHGKEAKSHRSRDLSSEHEMLDQVLSIWPIAQDLLNTPRDVVRIRPETAALHVSVLEGFTDLVQYQLNHVTGIDVNTADERGCSAMHFAAAGGKIAIAEILYLSGASVNPIPSAKESPLTIAASKGDVQFFTWLLKKGAKLNKQSGESALFTAVINNHDAIVRICIDAGARINARGKRKSALVTAAEMGFIDIVRRLIIAGGDVNDRDNRYYTPLMMASLEGHKEVVQLLIQAGADVNALYCNGEDILQTVSYNGSEEIVHLLLEAGANPNAQGSILYGNALTAAASSLKDSAEKVRLLLNAGADVNTQGGGCGTALMVARGCNQNQETIELLLHAGAEVERLRSHVV